MESSYTHTMTFLWVENWDRANEFYKKVLGLKKVYESDGWAEFAIPGIKNSYLALNKWGQEGKAPKDTFVTLGVSNLDAFQEKLKEQGVQFKGDVVTLDGEKQGIRMLKFFDTEGNVLTAAETYD